MTTYAAGTVKRALLSVFDKSGLVPFARQLHGLGVELLASGGTAAALAEAEIPLTKVEEFTGAREMIDGRVKTLHPRVHGGILADRRRQKHLTDLADNGCVPIDLVVCNLYPFQRTLAEGKGRDQLIENIDIGGPTLVRAAAKNVDGGVCVLSDPSDYESVIQNLRDEGEVSHALRQRLAAKAFRMIATYDLAIAEWIEGVVEPEPQGDAAAMPQRLPAFLRAQTLRYGENPHQRASLYQAAGENNGIAAGRLLAGKPLSYNNLLDMDGAYRSVHPLRTPGCSVVKHTNPCGLAEGQTQAEAFERALAGDPVSAFGGILGFNSPLEGATAEAIKGSKLFVECIVAPAYSPEALEVFKKRENLRLYEVPATPPQPAFAAHRIGGGLLVQDADPGITDATSWQVVTQKQPEAGWLDELAFAMRAAAALKSNAIAITRGNALLGAGAGQTSRVDATEQAIKKAGDQCGGAFLGSDAFFPFNDCVKLAAQAGIVAIAQPGGSKRDSESIAACDELGLCMVFTGRRHFRH